MVNKKKYERRKFLKKTTFLGIAVGCPLLFGDPIKAIGNEATKDQFYKNPNSNSISAKKKLAKLKITVLRRMLNEDFAKEYCQNEVSLCSRFKEGQEIFTDGTMPEGFCEYAWHNIYPNIIMISSGGTMKGWMKEDGMIITCCTDGIRPVVFKIERNGN